MSDQTSTTQADDELSAEDYAIRTRGLTRFYGDRCAVENLTINVPRGQVTALIGHNGAGKTTTIRMLLGLLKPTRGAADILGCDSDRLTPGVRTRIGYLAEGHFLWGWMRARDAARFQRETFPRWDQALFDSMIGYFGVDPAARINRISRGQRAGVSLAMTLATDPELLVLDDPSMGLDPVARRALVEGLLAFARRPNRTILICTHLLDDVERLAERIAVVDHGHLVVDAPLGVFMDRVTGYAIRGDVDAERVKAIPRLIDSRRLGDQTNLVLADVDDEVRSAIDGLGGESEAESLSLEDAVLAYLRPSAMIGSISDAVERQS